MHIHDRLIVAIPNDVNPAVVGLYREPDFDGAYVMQDGPQAGEVVCERAWSFPPRDWSRAVHIARRTNQESMLLLNRQGDRWIGYLVFLRDLPSDSAHEFVFLSASMRLGAWVPVKEDHDRFPNFSRSRVTGICWTCSYDPEYQEII